MNTRTKLCISGSHNSYFVYVKHFSWFDEADFSLDIPQVVLSECFTIHHRGFLLLVNVS